MNFPVLEIFGPTIQGEGMVIGRKTCFVRLAACDYQCEWCDSKFTWDGSMKPTLMTADEIVAQLKVIQCAQIDHVTISGGNPALYKGLSELVKTLHAQEYKVAIETQGSFWNDALLLIDEVTISPKPPSSNMDTNFTLLIDIMNRLEGRNVSLKVVVFDDLDLEYAELVHALFPEVPMFLQVGNDSAENVDEAMTSQYLIQRYRVLVERVMASVTLRNVRVLPQLHTLLWGNRRGV